MILNRLLIEGIIKVANCLDFSGTFPISRFFLASRSKFQQDTFFSEQYKFPKLLRGNHQFILLLQLLDGLVQPSYTKPSATIRCK